MKLSITTTTPEAFNRFGQIVQQPQQEPDAEGPGWSWWAWVASLDGGETNYAVGFLDLEPAELKFDWAERHMNTPEMVIPILGTCLLYVAPAKHIDKPGQMPSLEEFQVFRLEPGQAVILNAGVWHGAPMAEEQAAKAIVLLKAGTGEDDQYVQRFSDNPVFIQR